MRELAARDFQQLERDGFVTRDGMRPEAARAWRHAIVGLGHGAGVRVDTGALADGQAWAALNTGDPPLDLRRNPW